jgi:nucleotidyltransferase substrate binding protein (TIGR01987 family)
LTAKDIRWIQRFNNFNKAFARLKKAVKLTEERELSELEEQGLIQSFEYTHELAWNTLKDFLENRGVQNLYGSKDTSREAFKTGLIENGNVWMEMISSRNQTSHNYNEETVSAIVDAIINSYYAEFERFQITMTKLNDKES